MSSKSYIQPSRHNQQPFSDQEKSTNMREKRSIPTSNNNNVEEAEKKGKAEASETTKKKLLERKATEDINASADAFIKNFRQQLLIQRLQSIENYEQMLARGL